MEEEDELRRTAESFIRDLCAHKDGWEYSGMESLVEDPWMADCILMFNREDYVVCYVGFRAGRLLYVLQRIE